MTNILKLATASTLALTLAACASSTDDKYQVGVNDDDQYSVAEDDRDIELSDAQTFGMDDDDDFETTSTTTVKPMATSVMVGGAAMMPTKTIVENASAANNLTTLVALVKQAQLVDTLSSPGPFTVFAPTDSAFSVVPAATRNNLMMDENREQLQGILTYHVVPGRITAADLISKINMNNGSYTVDTVAGGQLNFFVSNDLVKIADASGTVATVTTADVMQSNGVVHVVNSVLMPN